MAFVIMTDFGTFCPSSLAHRKIQAMKFRKNGFMLDQRYSRSKRDGRLLARYESKANAYAKAKWLGGLNEPYRGPVEPNEAYLGRLFDKRKRLEINQDDSR